MYRIEDLETEYKTELQNIGNFADELGRAPLKSEIEEETRKKLIARCGSWRNALYQIGLEPVVKINPFSSTSVITAEKEQVRAHKVSLQDCYYRVLNPDEQTMADLRDVYQLKKTLGHTPDKKEISPEVRKRLQRSCGSLANALYQLEYMEEGRRND